MKLEISDEKAMDLAYFCKRATFDDAYERAHGETEKERKSMAYRILSAIEEIGNSLRKAGFSPR
jgi:hypothetical protein